MYFLVVTPINLNGINKDLEYMTLILFFIVSNKDVILQRLTIIINLFLKKNHAETKTILSEYY